MRTTQTRVRLAHTESAGADILMARGSTGASLSSWVFGDTRKSAGRHRDILLFFVTAETIAEHEGLAFNEELSAYTKNGGECVVVTSVGHGLCAGEYEEQVVYM